MKKIFAILLSAMLLLSLCACGTQPAEETTETTQAVEEVDYTPYMCPWKEDVVAKAKADGKMHYYFMAAEGYIISTTQTYADKWGDACLIVFPDGQTMLLDTAPRTYGPILLRNLQQMGITRLDYILISHPHSDHQNGVFHPDNRNGVLANIDIGQVYYRGGTDPKREDSHYVKDACEELNIPLQVIQRGDVLQFGDVTMHVLWPMEGTSETTVTGGVNVNDKSIVVRFDYQEHSSLFAGDLYTSGEAFFLELTGPEQINVDFLKVPHHGWGTSSSVEFLACITPELAVATARVPIPNNLRNIYSGMDIELLYDLIHGYIHVEADGSGEMKYETTRNNSPNDNLNIKSEDLVNNSQEADEE